MNNQQILEKLSIIVKSIKAEAAISESTALLGESVLDSLEFMNFITMVEEEFSMTISDDDISIYKLGIISNMISYLSLKRN